MNLKERGWEVTDSIGLAHDRDKWQTLVNMVMNLKVPQIAGHFLTRLGIAVFSRRTLIT
jgi:hypothetical protein